jgi:uncharacterized protein involved in oxidation of intracellular sulfur
MKSFLIILNEGPYGSERPYNGLRLAMNLQKKGARVTLFLMGDAVGCARKNQETPNGFYNVGRMVASVVRQGAAAT